MKGIRLLYIIALLMTVFLCSGQSNVNEDSIIVKTIEKEYEKYYYTIVLAISPSGEHIVIRETNMYGVNRCILYNNRFKTKELIDIGEEFQFLNDENLVVKNREGTTIKNLKVNTSINFENDFVQHIFKNESKLLMYSKKKRVLKLLSFTGHILWEKQNVDLFDVNTKDNKIVIYRNNEISLIDIDLDNEAFLLRKDNIVWLSFQGEDLYALANEANVFTVYQKIRGHSVITTSNFNLPQDYNFQEQYKNYTEVRENRYLIMAVLPSHDVSKDYMSPNVNITYSNQNSAFNKDFKKLVIYDLKEKSWKYISSIDEKMSVQVFLNENGDFVDYTTEYDSIENKMSQEAKMTLYLDYGRIKYDLGVKHIFKNSFYWHKQSNSFLYFDDGQWWRKNPFTNEVQEIFKDYAQNWVSIENSGLEDVPQYPITVTNDKNVLIFNSIEDIFLVNFKTNIIERITRGLENDMSNRVVGKQKLLQSSWNNASIAMVNLEKGIAIRGINKYTYVNDFNIWKNKKLIRLYKGEENIRDVISANYEYYLISQSFQRPIVIRKVDRKFDCKMMYRDSKSYKYVEEDGLKRKMIYYQTSEGLTKGALLFPKNYDPNKNYPMIVKVYDTVSEEILYYSIPDMRSKDGFNFLNYIHQGYFVLLPDINYKVGDLADSITNSVTAAVLEALKQGSIDEKAIGVVGLSFGGYEVGLLVGKTDLFKTASLGVMISDYISFSLSNTRVISQPNYQRVEYYQMRMGHSIFDDWRNYNLQSPIYYLNNVKIPILLWSGLKDDNIPPAQTRAYFLGLKRLGIKSILLEYTDEIHNILKDKNQKDLNLRMLQWMNYHLKGLPMADWMKPLNIKAPD